MQKILRILILSFLIGSIWTGLCCSKAKYPDGLYAELTTTRGVIVLALAYRETPMTVANFVGLAEGSIKNEALPEGAPFFDGTKFHRVVKGHVIQAGIPDTDGNGLLGYTFPNEIHSGLSHNRAGVLGMANGGPHTNGSQFYITLGDRSYLDGDYTVFGEVIEGLDVVFAIEQDDVINEIKIVRCGVDAVRFKADKETFQNLEDRVRKRVEEQERVKGAQEEAAIQKRWPNTVEMDSGLKYVIVREGKGEFPGPGSMARLQYSGEVLGGIKFFSTPEGLPNDESPIKEFVMEIGKSHITPGFDQSIVRMRVGEKRILIVPARLGYGTSGYYAREVEGKKRFVISPNSTLIYEVELLGLTF